MESSGVCDVGGFRIGRDVSALAASNRIPVLPADDAVVAWSFPYFSNPNGGALSTASEVVFVGDSDGNFIALDARAGHDLWHVQLGTAIYSAAITFEVDGKQYVTIPAGSALFAFALH